MKYEESLIIFLVLFIIIFIVEYFFINKRKLKLLNSNGTTKKGKKKKVKNISEIEYLVAKLKLDKKKLNKENMILWISIINSFIISIVSSVIIIFPIKLMWQLLIAFVLLFGLIYSLYEIYGNYLKRKEDKK